MNESATSLNTVSRKFFGFAVGHDPTSLYKAIEYPTPPLLASKATDYLVEQGLSKETPIIMPGMRSVIRPLFYNAVHDVQTILTNQLQYHHLPIEALPAIARDERTMRTIAAIAMSRDGIMRTMISPTSRGIYYDLSADASHLQPTGKLHPMPSGGCPFAANTERLPDPSPIFKRTISFAADLTALALKSIPK